MPQPGLQRSYRRLPQKIKHWLSQWVFLLFCLLWSCRHYQAAVPCLPELWQQRWQAHILAFRQRLMQQIYLLQKRKWSCKTRLTGLKLITRDMMNTIITLVQSGMIHIHWSVIFPQSIRNLLPQKWRVKFRNYLMPCIPLLLRKWRRHGQGQSQRPEPEQLQMQMEASVPRNTSMRRKKNIS